MMQAGLFANREPIAANVDPISSHLAAAEITRTGLRASQKRSVLNAVERFPNRTSSELADATGLDRYLVRSASAGSDARRFSRAGRNQKLPGDGTESRHLEISNERARHDRLSENLRSATRGFYLPPSGSPYFFLRRGMGSALETLSR